MADTLIEFTTTRWRCPACRRSYSRKSVATQHQAVCQRDPANRSCRTCAHDPLKAARFHSPDETCDAGGEPIHPIRGTWVLHCPLWVDAPEQGSDR